MMGRGPGKGCGMNRRLVLSTVAAGAVTATLTPVAYGAAEWCDDDPLVIIETPELPGIPSTVLPVHITNYAEGLENKVWLELVPEETPSAWIGVTMELATKPKGQLKKTSGYTWNVTIHVTIHALPDSRFRTKSVASSGEYATGVIYDTARGRANQTMTLDFAVTV